MSDGVDLELRSSFIWLDTVCKDCLPWKIIVMKQFSSCIFRPSQVFDAILYSMISNIGNSQTHCLQGSFLENSHTFLIQGLNIRKKGAVHLGCWLSLYFLTRMKLELEYILSSISSLAFAQDLYLITENA